MSICSVLYVPEGLFAKNTNQVLQSLNKRTFVTNEPCRIYSYIEMEALL